MSRCAMKECDYLAAPNSPFCEIEHFNDPSKCVMAGCKAEKAKFSVYCGMHDLIAHGTNMEVKGVKHDSNKPRYDLIPFKALEDVVGVLTYGAKKYAPENWRQVDDWRRRYFRAGIGHVIAWWRGEKLDPESGHKHLAHAVCCLMFLLELDS